MIHKLHKTIRLGFVPLCDCAPLVIARELGLFRKYGVSVTLSREVGWATIRAKIIYGELDAAHATAPMVFAATLGLSSIQVPCVTGLVLNLHGNGITISKRLWQAGVRDAVTLRRHIEANRTGRKLTFGIVFPFSSHNFLLRRWLRSSGIDPDRDVQFAVVPPPQMAANLKAGTLDGYCVGEPWNSMAVIQRAGCCVTTSAAIAPLHPEKVLMVRESFATGREGEHLAVIAALLEACRFCEQPENREDILAVLGSSRYLNVPAHAMAGAFGGPFRFGDGREEVINDLTLFSGSNANEPTTARAAWVLNAMRECGLLTDAPSTARRVFRPDIFHKAQELLALPV